MALFWFWGVNLNPVLWPTLATATRILGIPLANVPHCRVDLD